MAESYEKRRDGITVHPQLFPEGWKRLIAVQDRKIISIIVHSPVGEVAMMGRLAGTSNYYSPEFEEESGNIEAKCWNKCLLSHFCKPIQEMLTKIPSNLEALIAKS